MSTESRRISGTTYLEEWGFDDPKRVGQSEYTAVYELLADALDDCDEVDLSPDKYALVILAEVILTAEYMKKQIVAAKS